MFRIITVLVMLTLLLLKCGYDQQTEKKANEPRPIGVLLDKAPLGKGSQTDFPDERILWNLFHAKKYDQLTQQLQQLRQRYPKWRPPLALAEALQSVDQASKTADLSSHSVAGGTQQPDERVLWKLFHANKHTQLTEKIKHFKQRYPSWAPPKDLTRALQTTPPARGLVSHSVSSVASDPCPNLPARWARAEAHLKKHQPANAVEIYKRIIAECPTKNRLQTLEKARSRLDYADFNQLLELSSHYVSSPYLAGLKYHALKDRLLTHSPQTLAEHNLAVAEIKDLVDANKDANLATVIGWRYVDLNAFKQAQNWFDKSIAWHTDNDNAHFGLLLSLEKSGEFDKALAVYATLKNPSKQIKAFIAGILKAKAWQSLDQKQLDKALAYTAKAQEINALDPELTVLNAWIATKRGDHAKAAKDFEALYQQSPTKEHARGYIQNQVHVDRAVLSEKTEQSKGILLDEYNQFHGQELFDRKQFLSAYKQAPETFFKLENIDAPALSVGGNVRYKSGEDGLGRLDIFKAPIASTDFTANNIHAFKFALNRIQLFSGRPEQCQSPIGSLGANTEAKAACSSNSKQPFLPTQELSNALEIDFSYRKDGWFSPFVKLGSTPIGGVIDPTITFAVGFVQQANFGNWGLEAYSQSVRQSILSYTGITDPYSAKGQEWGRVVRTGIKPSVYYRFNENWNVSGTLDVAVLQGKNVKDNSTLAVSAGLSRNFPLSGFDYFNVGPSFNYEHYDKNLSHFTYGHGGYFSPEHYFNVGAGINFLTEEGKPYIIKGRVVTGYQDIQEADSAWFPLNNQGAGRYDAATQSGIAFDFELKGAWLITPTLQFGGGTAIRKTSGFDDYTGGLFLRYFFDNRKATVSTDIPEGMFSSMY